MTWLKNIFWNVEQHRLRALWRLLIVIWTWFTVIFILQLLIGVVVGIIGVTSGALTQEQLSNPQAINNYIAGLGWVMPVLQVAELLITVGVVWLAGRFMDRRKFVGFGLELNRDWWIDFGFGLFLGAILMTIVFSVEKAAGWITITGTTVAHQGGSFVFAILLALLTFVMVGFSEELLFRGYQLKNMAEGFNWQSLGPRWAIVVATLVSSAIFGMAHLLNPHATVTSTFGIFLAGIMLGLGYILTGKLAVPIGLHITWNFFQGNVFGFPVSGSSANVTTFIAIQQGGPDLWTGGAFGPEAGLLSILVMALGVLLTLGWVYWRYGATKLHLPLAEAPMPPASAVVAASVEPEGRGR